MKRSTLGVRMTYI